MQGASTLYEGWYGDNAEDNDPSAPAYDINGVITSLTNKAIAKVTGCVTSKTKMLQLRGKNKIRCKPFQEFNNCTARCLFDLNTDPCETTDIAEQHPEVSDRLSIIVTL